MPLPPWDETQPLGTAPASTIDEIFRDLKSQIRQRMDDIVVDWTADPVVIDWAAAPPSPSSLRTGLVLMLGPYDMATIDDEDDASYQQGYYQSDNVGTEKIARMNLPLFKGMKLKKIEYIISSATTTNMTVNFWRTSFTVAPTPVNQGLASSTFTVSNAQLEVLYTQEITIGDDYYYWLEFIGSSGSGRFRLYGVRITYDEVAT